MKKKLLLTLIALLSAELSVQIQAYDALVDGIYYNLNKSKEEATVTFKDELYYYYYNSYSGNIVIPSSFEYNGIQYSVTFIGESAFRETGVTSVTIPKSVKYVASDAFMACRELSSISVESGNTVYDSRNNCNAIIETSSNKLIAGCKNSVIPDGVTSIGGYAFSYCSGLTSVTIPKSVTSITSGAFLVCSGLSSISVDSGNPVYDSRNNCNAIIETNSNILIAGCKNTVIPNSVTSIGSEAFYGCSGLTSVTIPNSVTSIEIEAFCNCSGLTSVTIGNSVTYIGQYAFDGCYVLTSVTIPNSMRSIGDRVFRNCCGLTSVTIPNSVTSIGSEAFYNCSGLTSVTIPNSVTSIGKSSFYGCRGLTSVTIPNSVTSIGPDAFRGCSGLTSATIGKSVTSIGNQAFYGCRCLKEVVSWAESVPSTASNAFYDVYLSNVKLLVFHQSIENYQNSSPWSSFGTIATLDVQQNGFYYYFDTPKEEATITGAANSLSGNLSIPSYVEYQGVNYDVVAINDDAFKNNSSLTSVNIPNSVTSIGNGAFEGCSGLTALSIGENIKSIGQNVFKGCNGLTSIAVASGNTIYDSRNNCNAIIETESGKLIQGCNMSVTPDGVTSIGDNAFYNCSGLSSMTIPNSVTYIASNAFEGCYGLTSVTFHCASIDSWFKDFSSIQEIIIGDDVTSIGDNAFYGCSGLTSVTIPNSVTSIGDQALYNCCNLTSVNINSNAVVTRTKNLKNIFGSQVKEYVIGDDVTSIGDNAFYGCSDLTSVTIPNSVTSIGDNAFSGCRGLTSIDIPNSVTSIGDWAFSSCSGLTSITIPNSVIYIGGYAFYYCRGLTSVTIPNSVIFIGGYAFYNTPFFDNMADGVIYLGKCLYKYKGTMPENTNITIQEGTVSISECAFDSCSGLTSVTIPNSMSSFGVGAFYGCSGLTSITIPNSVTSIGDCTFSSCSGLTSVTIPNSVTSIGDWAFSSCSGLTSITIPNSVIFIGDYAFYGCSNMKTFTCYAVDIPTANSLVFEGIDLTGATLYVPASALEDYEETTPWKRFGTILPLEDEGITTPINMATTNGVDQQRITVYDLNGRKTTSSQRGLLIMKDRNGKTRKVVVK